MSWVRLTPEEARQHPRYGVAGWLYALFAAVLFAIVADLVEWVGYGAGSDRPAWLILLDVVLATAVLVAGFRRWQSFPELTIAAIWLGGALSLGYAEHMRVPVAAEDPLDPRTVGIAGYLFFSTLLSWALLVSERVNVTYKLRCRHPAD